MSSSEAYKKLQKWGEKALFIDVRTRAEVAFVGMPTMVNANIPYMLTDGFNQWNDRKQTFQLKRNRGFVSDVGKLIDTRGLSKESPIILICRSGSRSAKAANILFAAGFTQVYTVTDGFEGDKAKSGPRKGERVVNGWKNAALPWAYKLNRTAMYWSE